MGINEFNNPGIIQSPGNGADDERSDDGGGDAE